MKETPLTLLQIMQAVQNMKLDLPSTDYIEISVGTLETLVSQILKQDRELNKMERTIITLNEKLDLLNDLAKVSLRRKTLQAYLEN